MTFLRLAYLAIGLGLFWLVLSTVDLAAVHEQIMAFGIVGVLAILGIYTLEFAADTAGWQATIEDLRGAPRWFRRLFLIRLIGEAVSEITPMASLGGEPVKALLLKKHYGVGYAVSAPSLVLATTVSSVALVVFLCGGFAFVLADARFPTSYKAVAGLGLGVLAAAIGAFVAVQRYRLSSRLGRVLARTRFGARVLEVLHHIEDFDLRLARFHTEHRRRFVIAFVLMLGNWYLGVVAIWCTTRFLGAPISLTEAYMVETLTQLVRAGAFFIPAGLGVQEGAFVVVFEVLTGQAALGLATGLVKRAREIAWIALGLLTGWIYSFKPSLREREAAREQR